MTEYSSEELRIIQKFVDAYRFAPAILPGSQGFINPNLTGKDYRTIDLLVEKGSMVKRQTPVPGGLSIPFYRFSNDFDLGILVRSKKIILK